MEMHRAFSLVEVTKASVEGDQRIIEGIATTPEPDRVGDIVESSGARFKNPLPLLWQHRSDEPVGHATFEKPTEKGIRFTARLPKIDEPGKLKDRIDEAWQSVKSGLVRAVSIGFRSLEHSVMENGGYRFLESEILELSLVTIPANASANIQTIKSIDAEVRAASGREDGSVTTAAKQSPGVTGSTNKRNAIVGRLKAMNKPMTIAERIAALETEHSEKHARLDALMAKSAEEGRTLDAEEDEEFETLAAEVKALSTQIKRNREIEAMKIATAKPVENVRTADQGTQARSPVQVKRREILAPGIGFARLVRCKGLAHITHESPREVAKQLYGEDSNTFGLLTKASVVAGANIDGNWATNLVGDETNAFADFVEYLRPMTILGKFGMNGVPSLRRVPFRVPLISQTGGGQGYWVGEGKPKPLTAFDFSRTTLEPLKVANICAVTMETLRDSSPSAEGIIRDSLAAALAERLDTDFIDPAKTASAGVSPASITNGVTAPNSAGTTADDVRADIHTAFSAFIAANNAPTSGVWIMSAQTALTIGLMLNALGQPEFSGMNMNGGTLAGLPVITSEYIGSVSAGSYIYLVNASDIYLADEGGVSVDMSREASVQMLDNPTNDSVTPTATTMVSFWQTNTVGFLAERTINWAKRRASAVAAIDSVAYALT